MIQEELKIIQEDVVVHDTVRIVEHAADIYDMAYGLSNANAAPYFEVSNYNIVKYNEFTKPSLFKNHTLCVRDQSLTPQKNKIQQDSLSGMFLFYGLLFFALLFYKNSNNLRNLSLSLFNIRHFFSKGKEKFWVTGITQFLFIALILCFYSLLVFQARFLPIWDSSLLQSPSISNPLQLFKYCLLFTTVFLLIKYVLIKIIAFIFKTKEASTYYLQMMFNYDSLIAIIGLPLLFLSLTYESQFQINLIAICLFLALLSLCMRIIRMFIVKVENTKFSYIHIFLYLCALEFVLFLSSWKAFWIFFSI
ncbi:MAG: DUF4271 domain-containing protein [Bacteroidales bacterium]